MSDTYSSPVDECRIDHERIKADELHWSAIRIGVQHVPAYDGSPGYDLELGNCAACKSTLARRPK